MLYEHVKFREMIIWEVRRSQGTPPQSFGPDHADGKNKLKITGIFLHYMVIFSFGHGNSYGPKFNVQTNIHLAGKKNLYVNNDVVLFITVPS